MNDLLGDVPSPRYGEAVEQEEMDMETGLMESAGTDPKMQLFFDQVNDIKNNMEHIRHRLHSLQEANEESKLVTRAPAMKALKERMEADIDDVLKVAQAIKRQIEALDRANLESRKTPGCEEGTGTDRTRMSITTTMKRKLKELMNEFQELRSKFQSEYREVVERRYYTVTGKRADSETIDTLIETGDSESIFQKAIQEQGRGQLMDTLAEIQERHSAVQDIEKQLLELHQIFMDMAVLVESQGELLDNIEVQVGQAVDHVQHGTKQLVEARKTQLNTRKWICCGVILVIIIIVVIILVVVKPWDVASHHRNPYLAVLLPLSLPPHMAAGGAGSSDRPVPSEDSPPDGGDGGGEGGGALHGGGSGDGAESGAPDYIRLTAAHAGEDSGGVDEGDPAESPDRRAAGGGEEEEDDGEGAGMAYHEGRGRGGDWEGVAAGELESHETDRDDRHRARGAAAGGGGNGGDFGGDHGEAEVEDGYYGGGFEEFLGEMSRGDGGDEEGEAQGGDEAGLVCTFGEGAAAVEGGGEDGWDGDEHMAAWDGAAGGGEALVLAEAAVAATPAAAAPVDAVQVAARGGDESAALTAAAASLAPGGALEEGANAGASAVGAAPDSVAADAHSLPGKAPALLAAAARETGAAAAKGAGASAAEAEASLSGLRVRWRGHRGAPSQQAGGPAVVGAGAVPCRWSERSRAAAAVLAGLAPQAAGARGRERLEWGGEGHAGVVGGWRGRRQQLALGSCAVPLLPLSGGEEEGEDEEDGRVGALALMGEWRGGEGLGVRGGGGVVGKRRRAEEERVEEGEEEEETFDWREWDGMRCTYKCRNMVKAEFMAHTARVEKQLADLTRTHHRTAAALTAAEEQCGRLQQQVASLEREGVAVRESGKEREEQRRRAAERAEESIRVQMKRCHELELQVLNLTKRSSEAEAKAAAAEARAVAAEARQARAEEEVRAVQAAREQEVAGVRAHTEGEIARLEAEVRMGVSRMEAMGVEMESLEDEADALRAQHAEACREVADVRCELELVRGEGGLGKSTSAVEANALLARLREDNRLLEEQVSKAERQQEGRQRWHVLQQEVLVERARADAAEAAAAVAADMAVQLRHAQRDLQRWRALLHSPALHLAASALVSHGTRGTKAEGVEEAQQGVAVAAQGADEGAGRGGGGGEGTVGGREYGPEDVVAAIGKLQR
ncbi:unnamed protein product [Closterium sp. NIES-54]